MPAAPRLALRAHWLGAAAQPPTLFQTRPATAWQPTLVRLPPHPGAHLLLPAKAVPTGLPPTMRTTWRGHHCRLQRSLNSRVLELPACPRTTREQGGPCSPRGGRCLVHARSRNRQFGIALQRRPDQGIEVRIAVGRPPIDGRVRRDDLSKMPSPPSSFEKWAGTSRRGGSAECGAWLQAARSSSGEIMAMRR